MRPHRREPGAPLDRERARDLLCQSKTIASVWTWLEGLGVPVRDRGDMSQEVFLAACASLHTYDPHRGRIDRWLNKITVHLAAHYWQRASRRREHLTPEDLLDGATDQTPGADEQLAGHEARSLVLALLGEIDAEAGALLIGHAIDGIPMAELAEQRGITLSTAYKLRTRAMAELWGASSQRREEGG